MKKGRIHPALRRMTGILLILTIMAGTLTDAMESLFPAVSSLFRAMAEAGNEIEESVQEELWRYAAREDGFLSITGYTGDDTSALSVPVQIAVHCGGRFRRKPADGGQPLRQLCERICPKPRTCMEKRG